KELAGEAALLALGDADLGYPEALFAGNMMSGSANKQIQLGAQIADWLGFHHRAALSIESACGSGAAAFRAAVMAIGSGEIATALVIGVEKMTDSPSVEITSQLATAADAELESEAGISFVALNALIMQRYMFEYGWKTTDFAAFSINAHANGVHNPYARFQDAITRKSFETAGIVCDPINLLDASPIGDGAAALLLTSDPARLKHRRVKVVASSAATDTLSIQHRKQPTWLCAAEASSKAAYSQTGFTPNSIDFFEYHDAFSIMAALSLEASGFCSPGEGPKLANDGSIKLTGRIPVATMGGLKARGHPVGATGAYQLVEVTQQLRELAGINQVEGAKVGMAQNIGGSGSNVITHILSLE
ncbi:MAG: thiolase domain-containing protein, partial [Chloroflexi bacterium]|nr:thiolase domain-containing protein [Chloroflexota bacterium]